MNEFDSVGVALVANYIDTRSRFIIFPKHVFVRLVFEEIIFAVIAYLDVSAHIVYDKLSFAFYYRLA